MEHQFRRGIYRPNAQRLSISLAPLVAQRSLLARVKADFATNANYAESTPTEESPALLSTQIVSAVLTAISAAISTAMSSASVYSQDSWKAESPFVAVVPRQMANAFSPSTRRPDKVEGDSDKYFTVNIPSARSALIPHLVVSSLEIKEDNNTKTDSESDVVPALASDAVNEKSVRSYLGVGLLSPVENRQMEIKVKIDEQSARSSGSSEVFRKVMSRLSFQPSKYTGTPK